MLAKYARFGGCHLFSFSFLFFSDGEIREIVPEI